MVAGARCIALKVDTLSAHQLGSFNNNRCNLGVFVRSSRLSARAKLEQQQPNCSDKKLLQNFEHLRVCQWQSSCAILNSHLVANEEVEKKYQAGSSETGLVTTSTSSFSLLPRPLSIAGLAPAPMHGSQLRVAYYGMPGAYSEAATTKAYPDCDAVPCDQFEAAFQAVELWVAARALLPVESSQGGSVHRNYDLLLSHRLHIVGEVQLPIYHCLLALPGTRKEDLRRVISHPLALTQCEHTLTKLGLKVVREAFNDTALAAQVVAEQYLRDTAAIASARAADIYGLTVLAEGIQDDTSNVTRFMMLAREPVIPRVDQSFKTSIVFTHDDGTDILFKVLSAFAFRNISVTKIEIRPQRNRSLRVVNDSNSETTKYFEYLFYIHFEASMADPRAQNALTKLQEFTNFLRVLGSYPMDMTPLVKTP